MKVAEFLFQSIPLLIQLYSDQYLREDLAKTLRELENDSNLPRIQSYDFIVVGGGSAGCVVAARLSERFTVLLLEAGGTPPPAATALYFASTVALAPNINYFFQSVPQKVAQNKKGIVHSSTGKMLGGSGSHNDMVHNRGSPRDFDNWAQVTGDRSWAYENVLSFFKKYENFVGERYGNNREGYYGSKGPINVETNVVPILPLWFEAGTELGYPTEDPNGFQVESFAPFNRASREGQRSSSYSEYIRPIEKSRQTLTLVRYANVSEVLLDATKKAYGVAYTRHGFPQIAYATKEIVLSAGVFSSPLLLMKSGIGPADVLVEAEIPLKVNLASVGQGLHEHPYLTIGSFSVNDSRLFPSIGPEDTERLIGAFHRGEGPFTLQFQGPQCFLVSSTAAPGWPNILIVMEVSPPVLSAAEPQVINFYLILGRPQSRGSVRLNGTLYKAGVRDDVQLALIDYGLLTSSQDVEDMLEGIDFVFRIAEETKAFRSLNTTYGAGPDPACTEHEFRSKGYWKCVLVQQATGYSHMAGSCGMGPDDSDSVVDSKLRVRGVSGLRIIDASIMPAVPNANLNAPVLMIAEKGADEILKDWHGEPFQLPMDVLDAASEC